MVSRIDYAKKKEKRAVIKTQKDESVRGDGVYKSHTIMVASGESPNSGTQLSILQSRLTSGISIEPESSSEAKNKKGSESRTCWHGCQLRAPVVYSC